MLPLVVIGGFAAAAVGVSRWYRRGGGSPVSAYSQSDREGIARMLASRRKNNSY